MAPTQTLELTNGEQTDDLKIQLGVDGVIEENGEGTITKNVADETVDIPFRGTITTFDVVRGAGSASIDDESVRFKDLVGWDTREHAGETADRPTTEPDHAAVGGTDVADATPRGSEAGRPDNTITTTDEYRQLWKNIAVPFDERVRVSVADGTYSPGAIQRTILGTEGRRSVEIVGNNANPYAVDISAANHNLVDLVKDEHTWFEGMLWGRTQFAGVGDPMCRNMVFTDRNRPDDSPAASSSIGGKPATGRFINCEFGHRDDPDEHSAVWYGKGEVHFDRKNTFRATGDAYLVVKNTVTVYIGGDQTFASGDKEVVRGTGIYPDDLGDGLNKIEPGRVL